MAHSWDDHKGFVRQRVEHPQRAHLEEEGLCEELRAGRHEAGRHRDRERGYVSRHRGSDLDPRGGIEFDAVVNFVKDEEVRQQSA